MKIQIVHKYYLMINLFNLLLCQILIDLYRFQQNSKYKFISPPSPYKTIDQNSSIIDILIDPVYEKTENVFSWILNLYQISTIKDFKFDHDTEINNLIMKRGNFIIFQKIVLNLI